jgi:hypothetical protein
MGRKRKEPVVEENDMRSSEGEVNTRPPPDHFVPKEHLPPVKVLVVPIVENPRSTVAGER